MKGILCLLLALVSPGPALPARPQEEDRYKVNPTPALRRKI